MKRAAVFCALALGAVRMAAAVPGGDGEDAVTVKSWGAIQNLAEKHSGAASLAVLPGRQAVSGLVPVDPGKSYRVSAFFKAAGDKGKLRGYLGLKYYDADKNEMNYCGVWPVLGTEATLAKAVAKGDPAASVAPAAWRTPPPWLYAVAFDVKDDLSDLPNSSVCLWGRPLPRGYPAGTRIRLHRYCDPPGVGGVVVPRWTEYSFHVSGEAGRGDPNGKNFDGKNYTPKFWNGTKYVKVVVANGGLDGCELLVDDIVVRADEQKED